jgi:hypothetical protein
MTPVGKAFAPFQCDFGLAAVYEVCQALPEASFICLSPTIGNWRAQTSQTDKTDKMAWSYFGNLEKFGNVSSVD